MNLSSLVVDVRPESLASVQAEMAAWPGVEVQASSPQGKLVVTLETDSDYATTEIFSRINAIDGVMAVAMVYHRFEPEPEQEVLHDIDAT
ncbi:MAG: chaperone NapD [Betaproteobacteria bacterium]|nr:chaperone NapD [Betaproteobacteria bacterium]